MQKALYHLGMNFFGRTIRDEPFFTYTGLAMLALCVPTLCLMYFDTRTFEGANVWIKPLKFELSIAIFLLTLAFFARFLPTGMTKRMDYRLYSALVVCCAIAEIVWIAGAAAFAVASHFNPGPVMSVIYSSMGILAVILTSSALVYGIAILKAEPLSPLMRSIAASLILTFALTILVASRLAANESHFVGEAIVGGAVPLLGWSTEVGDLRVAHFFATHAMHFIPALAFAFYIVIPAVLTNITVIAIGIAYTAFTFAIFAQALAGRPFIS